MAIRRNHKSPPVVLSYIKAIEAALKIGTATEHTHRPALKILIEDLRESVTATNEPRRIACGSPDYIVNRNGVPLGYIEAKDVGADLNAAEQSDQLTRYRASLSNLILTNYLDFNLYRNGELIQTASLGFKQKTGEIRLSSDGAGELVDLFRLFFDAEVPTVDDPRDLAERMARMARLIDDLIRRVFANEGSSGDLHAQFDAFKKVLIAELSVEQFADMYAQTITYGLFAARCNHIGPGFRRDAAGSELPKTNPFLRRLFNNIAGHDLDDRIAWAVDDLATLLGKADMTSILADFGRSTRRLDPVVHFYETFLAAYDPKLREIRGVYYTPEPVVDFIVRSVDLILKHDLKVADGLADKTRVSLKRPKSANNSRGADESHRVQILDPACGTGTFLHAVVANIHERFAGSLGLWPGYVASHLLPRIYGFELLMAPYAVAHMKLGIQLKELGYGFGADERLRVFLTNTLDEAHDMAGLPLFSQWLTQEANAAGEAKKNAPIMVVIGNPPYSGHSANSGNWIGDLLKDYKTSPELQKPGQAKWLSDDYVKFIRFAQWRIEQTGHGIIAFITNHSYLDNPTFLDMRSSLMSSFDDLYVIDLHGNSKRREESPHGEKDQNVFDIQQGVAISLFVRRTARSSKCTVRRADVWGSREGKYTWLANNDVRTVAWQDVTPIRAPWLFVPQDRVLQVEYEQGWSVADIFSPAGDPAPGVVTTHDDFAISWTPAEAIEKVESLLATSTEAEARAKFKLCSQSQWNYARAKRELADGAWRNEVVPILYRTFDLRWTVWNSNVSVHRRMRVMRHMLNRGNIGLIVNRQVNGDFAHTFCSIDVINDCTLSNKTKERSYLLPLWSFEAGDLLNTEGPRRRCNIDDQFMEEIAIAIGDDRPSPELIFSYIYATLYAPSYRVKYNDFLKRNFPRVPLPRDAATFNRLAFLGQELIDLHLFHNPTPVIASFPRQGSNRVERIEFRKSLASLSGEGAVYINGGQFFDHVPLDVWAYKVGAYQVAQKWLKDRKGRVLTYDELEQYRQILAALALTIRTQSEIDIVISGW